MSWDPDTYLAFADHRERPIAELMGRIPPLEVARAVDLGCGTGNSTAAIAKRFPSADLTGVDNSPQMLAKAKKDLPSATWIQADVSQWQVLHGFDLILSNAALHWVPGHNELFARLLNGLNKGGALAVQMPRNFAAPSHILLFETAKDGPWADKVGDLKPFAPMDPASAYYGRIAPHVRHFDMWETTYYQVLEGEDAVFNWVSGSALTAYLPKLEEGAERDAFCETYKSRLKKVYPKSEDGKTLFAFTRLFMVAVK
jgi:trans-aconitate 2-methyltransferase